MNQQIIGWDVGGAHLKAALLSADGEILKVIQQPCALWKGIDQLSKALKLIMQEIGAGQYRHAITMTGELVDCFAGREQGVQAIIQTMRCLLPEQELWIFAGKAGLIAVEQVTVQHTLDIASANWLASATLVAGNCRNALFVDIGSTTTDILLIENNALKVRGYTDYHRLVSGELLYTGVIRTAVMAIAQRAEFNGEDMGLMAEYFATMADVYRLTGDLHAAHDQAETADGAGKTPADSARRLSRLTGYEFSETDWPLWLAFAQYLKNRQKQMIHQACVQQILRANHPAEISFIGAGVGRFLLKEIAAEQGIAYRDFSGLFKTANNLADIDAADCAPAVAVGYLGLKV